MLPLLSKFGFVFVLLGLFLFDCFVVFVLFFFFYGAFVSTMQRRSKELLSKGRALICLPTALDFLNLRIRLCWEKPGEISEILAWQKGS